jgi:iron(III) transport system substrate-binding protein
MTGSKLSIKFIACLLASAILFLPALISVHAEDARLIEAAQKEGAVIGYTSLDQEIAKAQMDLFNSKYKLKGSFFRGNTTVVMDRAMAEFRAGKVTYDVVYTSNEAMRFLKNQGLFAAYSSPLNKNFDKDVIDPFFGPRYRMVILGILYNRKLVKPEDAPKSYDDLLDPKWKGKLVSPDPSLDATATAWYSSLHFIMGSKQKAENWINRFAEQKPTLVASPRPAMAQIVSGEKPVGISYIHYVATQSDTGAPLDYVKGMPVYLGDGHYIALSTKAPHPNAAKLFIDYFLGQESMDLMAKEGYFVSQRGVYPPLPGAEQVLKGFLQMVPMTDSDYRQRKNEFKKIFQK